MQYNSAIAMVGGFSVSFLKNTILDIFFEFTITKWVRRVV